MKKLDDPSTGVVDAGFDLTSGLHAAQAIAVPNDCEFDGAVTALINALGRARWCERAPHRDPEDLDNLSSIDPTDFAAEWPWVAERFRYFYERPYELVESAAQDIEDSLGELRASNMGALLDVKDSMGGWAGDAKDAFTSRFLNRLLMPGLSEQQRLLGELQAAMWAYDVVLRKARANGYQLALETKSVLDSLTETSPNDAKVALGVLSFVVGTVTAFVTGGTTGGVILGLLGTGIAGASTGIDASTTITGDTTAEVMNTLLTALDTLTNEMNTAEQVIADAVSETQAAVEADLRATPSRLMPCEPENDVPDLTDGEVPPKGQFRPVT